MAIKEVSVMTKKDLVVSSILITGAERNISFSLINASSCSFPQKRGSPSLSGHGEVR